MSMNPEFLEEFWGVGGGPQGTDGAVYSFDKSRGMWLSINRVLYTYSRNRSSPSGGALEIFPDGTSPANETMGYPILRDSVITAIGAWGEEIAIAPMDYEIVHLSTAGVISPALTTFALPVGTRVRFVSTSVSVEIDGAQSLMVRSTPAGGATQIDTLVVVEIAAKRP